MNTDRFAFSRRCPACRRRRSLTGLFAFYALFGLVGAFTNPITYIAAVSAWFDRRRGLALGIAVAGPGLGGAVLPSFVVVTTERGGWPVAFYGMAFALVVIVLPSILAFVHDDPAARGHVPDGDAAAHAWQENRQAIGIPLAEAVSGRTFWIIIAVFALFGSTKDWLKHGSLGDARCRTPRGVRSRDFARGT